MKVKKVLRFYFYADRLEKAFDGIIYRSALGSASIAESERCAEKICGLIGEKQKLSRFWAYLDKVLCGFTQSERSALGRYASLRCGIKKLGDEERRAIKRAAVKFKRRARRIESFAEALGLVGKYYSLIPSESAGYLSG